MTGGADVAAADELPEDDSWLDEDAEPGETAIDVRDAHQFLHVVNEHPQPAGEMVINGEVFSDLHDVTPDRRVLMVVFHDDLSVAEENLDDCELRSHKQILEAVADGILTPTPYPSSLVAPVPEPLLERIHAEVDDVD